MKHQNKTNETRRDFLWLRFRNISVEFLFFCSKGDR
jgi:hypothetical protein